MAKEKIYVILLNYNGWKDTIECLESVIKLTGVDFSIVVVDNKSTDDSIQKIIEWSKGDVSANYLDHYSIKKLVLPFIKKPVHIKFYTQLEADTILSVPNESIFLITSESNNGFSAGNNIGINFALKDSDCKYIWLLNNDTVVSPQALLQLVNFYKKESINSKLGIVGNRLLHYYKPEVQQVFAGKFNKWIGTAKHLGENEPLMYTRIPEIYDYAIGASLFVSKEYVKDVGLLEETYFLYYEELDWTIRGKKLGWTTKIDPNTVIYHKYGSSTGNNNPLNRSEFSDIIHIKSKTLFLKKHFPWALFSMAITLPFVILNRLKRRQAKRVPKMIKIFLQNAI